MTQLGLDFAKATRRGQRRSYVGAQSTRRERGKPGASPDAAKVARRKSRPALSPEQFHAANPWVMDELLRLSLETRRYQPQWGIAAAFEVLRYQRRRTHGDDFKMNNSHRAWYARELMRREPRLGGFFRTRKSVADREGNDA